MGLDGYSAERGATRNPVYDEQLRERTENLQHAKRRDVRVVFVHDYDPVAQTVDVVLADDRRAHPIRGVPILGGGGNGVRIIRAWKGRLQTDKPDIGFLVMPRLGGGRRTLDFVRRDSRNLYDAIEQTAIFCGGVPAPISAGETPTANVVDRNPALHEIGKGDNGVVKASGAGLLIKENDDVVIRGKRVMLLGLDQTESDLEPVALQGGDVPPASDRVYAG